MLLGFLLRVAVPRRDLVERVAEFGFAEQEAADTAREPGRAVVGGFGTAVGHVDAFAEGVAVERGLGRGDAKALGQDAAVVRGAGAVPGGWGKGVLVGVGVWWGGGMANA